jgi:hypothetical protein
MRNGGKCKPVDEAIDFWGLDWALVKIEEQELAAEVEEQHIAAWQCKVLGRLQWLHMQKCLLKEWEQKMFDKELSEIEELECLEGHSMENPAHVPSGDLSMDLAVMSPGAFECFLNSLPLLTNASGVATAGSLWDSLLIPRCFLCLGILSIWWDITDLTGLESSLLWIHSLPESWNGMFPV